MHRSSPRTGRLVVVASAIVMASASCSAYGASPPPPGPYGPPKDGGVDSAETGDAEP